MIIQLAFFKKNNLVVFLRHLATLVKSLFHSLLAKIAGTNKQELFETHIRRTHFGDC